MAGTSIKVLELESFNVAIISGSFQPINPTPTAYPSGFIRIINTSTTGVIISYDGITDHDYVPAGTIAPGVPFQQMAQPKDELALLAAGSTIYLRSNNSGTGVVYLAVYYL